MAKINEPHGQNGASAARESQSSNATEYAETSFNVDAFKLDPWQHLKGFTRARIALGRVGSSLPTKEVLEFGMAHATARDAVHLALDVDALNDALLAQNFGVVHVQSQAENRPTYLLRPDLGRKLSEVSRSYLQTLRLNTLKGISNDLLVVVGDGLSSLAVQRYVEPLLTEMQQCLPDDWNINTVVIATQARVAIADEIGEHLGAKLVVMLIGERPGLSSPDSLGIYLTYNPKAGLSDADRNCISNVRPEGLSYAAAAKKLMWLAKEAMRLKVSGVGLKDESDVVEIAVQQVLAAE